MNIPSLLLSLGQWLLAHIIWVLRQTTSPLVLMLRWIAKKAWIVLEPVVIRLIRLYIFIWHWRAIFGPLFLIWPTLVIAGVVNVQVPKDVDEAIRLVDGFVIAVTLIQMGAGIAFVTIGIFFPVIFWLCEGGKMVRIRNWFGEISALALFVLAMATTSVLCFLMDLWEAFDWSTVAVAGIAFLAGGLAAADFLHTRGWPTGVACVPVLICGFLLAYAYAAYDGRRKMARGTIVFAASLASFLLFK